MPRDKKGSTLYYDPGAIVDDPTQHAYSRSLGLLTWSTWDRDVRPFEQRLREFLSAFPPGDPVKYVGNGGLDRRTDGSFTPVNRQAQLERFTATDGRSGCLSELLARYGLKIAGAPPWERRSFAPPPFRETAQRRNIKLRVLHGAVDVEPHNMDAAKAEYVDREEKKRAASDVRDALRRMREELASDSEE